MKQQSTIQDLLATHQPKNGRFYTIAIDGRGGCGKTTLAALLKAAFPDFVVLNGDDYFEPLKKVCLVRGKNHAAIDAYRNHPDHAKTAAVIEAMEDQGIGIDFATK